MHEAVVHVDRPVRIVHHVVANRAVPAVDSRAHSSVRQPRARERRPARIEMLTQRRRCRHQLERRSRRVQAVARAIEERVVRAFRSDDRELAAPKRRRRGSGCFRGRRVGPRIADARQQLAAIGIEHHRRSLACALLRVGRDDRGHAKLQVRIDRQVHVVRLLEIAPTPRWLDRSDAVAPAGGRGSRA